MRGLGYRQKDGQKDPFSPRYFQTSCFPDISTKFSVYILLLSGVTVKPMGKVFNHFLLPYFLTKDISACASLLSHSISLHSLNVSQSLF